MKVAAVVLAAGESRRLGSPKQLIRIAGETLLERTVRVCREGGCEPIVVVLGAAEAQIRGVCSLDGAMVVVNEHWQDGMATSISAGLSYLGTEIDGCVITTCDMPAVSAEHLRELMATGEMTASAYEGRCGVPAYFPRSAFLQLMALQGDAGARSLLRECPTVALAGGELDIDTPQDLQHAMQLFG